MSSTSKHIKIEDLNKTNVWTLNEAQLNKMLIDGRKLEGFAEIEQHCMNIIRPVFDIEYLNRDNERRVKDFTKRGFEVFPTQNEGENNAVAIRKHRIARVNDLSLENVGHLTAPELLQLIADNMGTGWQGLPLAVQDIIESAFCVDCAVLPAAAIHRKGGIIDRRKAEGYSVLEVERGTWIEGIFAKAKPNVEKPHFSALNTAADEKELPEDDEDGESDEEKSLSYEESESNDEMGGAEDEETEDLTDQPEIEDIEVIDEVDEDDEEE